MAKAKNYFAWQGRLVNAELGRRVLEVGCGMGNFTRMLLDREAVLAVDAESACIEQWKLRYSGFANLSARVCDAESPEFLGLQSFHPDSCVCLNVLEHIEHDEEVLRRMGAVLDPGGAVVLIVPAFPALSGPIDARLGHFRRYTRASLVRAVSAAGLKVRKLRYLNSAGFFGWWMNARVFKRQAQSESQIEIFDRAIVPWLAPLEDLVHPPFGQSLLAVLGKA